MYHNTDQGRKDQIMRYEKLIGESIVALFLLFSTVYRVIDNDNDVLLSFVYQRIDIDNGDILNAKLQLKYEDLIGNLDSIQRKDLEWLMK